MVVVYQKTWRRGEKMIELEESIMLDGKMITGMKIEMESSNIPPYPTVLN